MTELLLSWGVNVNAQDDEGVSALMLAARDGDAPLLQQVLDRGATVDARSRTGWTALTYAAWKGHTDVARRLLRAGADPTLRDRSSWTALMHATSRAAEIGAADRSAVVDSLHTKELASRGGGPAPLSRDDGPARGRLQGPRDEPPGRRLRRPISESLTAPIRETPAVL